jgi:hypothetical protein
MPDVALFTATEPLPKNAKVIIKYVVEVEGLPVYCETYDVASSPKSWRKMKKRLSRSGRAASSVWPHAVTAGVSVLA